jgi:hypothetical protein
MTDLEMTKLCAEAMEPEWGYPGSSKVWSYTTTFAPVAKKERFVRPTYDPLIDDAQAMALVKKIELSILRIGGKSWTVAERPRIDCVQVDGADLNRAIVECVAKMQKAKNAR